MRVASITETKNRLSELIDYVKRGESVLITDRGVPVARLESAASSDPDELDGRTARLVRAGILRPPRKKPSSDLLATPPLKLPPGVSVLESLLEERREGR